MRIPLGTQSSVKGYIENREWTFARIDHCPPHSSGGYSFVRQGTYRRVMPTNMCIARWYRPRGHWTFSLLPDFLVGRMPGLLASIDAAVAKRFQAAASRRLV
jgi:hypothetical protein